MTAKKRPAKVPVKDDGIPHGLRGHRAPYNCPCDVCRLAWNAYCTEKRNERKAKAEAAAKTRKGPQTLDEVDELLAKRKARKAVVVPRKPRAATESNVSDPNVIGAMEKAIIEECADLPRAKERPTLVVAARNLAKVVDNPKLSSIHTSTTKQIMVLLADLHGDDDKSKATGRRKSGGRLATVGNLTKVKRKGA